MKKLKHIWKKAKQNTKIIFKSLKKYIKDTSLEDTVDLQDTTIEVLTQKTNFWENEAHKKDDKIFKLEKNIKDAIDHIKTHQLIYQSQYEEMSGFDNHLLEILERK